MSTSSDTRPSRRPRQVTTGAVLVIVSCSLVVLSLADTLNRLNTTDTREAVQAFLREPPGAGLGIGLGQVLELVRWYALASGALAATALVFAVFVLRRDTAARLGLTLTAVLLVLTVPVTGLLPLFVVIGVLLVWSRPGRDWYRGRAATRDLATAPPVQLMQEQGPPPAPYPFGTRPDGPPPQAPAQPPPADVPGVVAGQPPYSAPAGAAWYGAAPAPGPAPGSGRRPWTVTAAAVLTWVGAGATLALMVMFALVLAAGPDAFVEEFDRAARQSGVTISREQILALGWSVDAVFLLWSIAAVVLAVLAVRRSNAGRIALAVSAGMTVVVSLLAILSMIAAVTLLLGVVTVVMLFTGGANQWYRDRGSLGSGSPYAPPYAPPSAGSTVAPPPYSPPPERQKPW